MATTTTITPDLPTLATTIATGLTEDLKAGRVPVVGIDQVRGAINAREHAKTLNERQIDQLEFLTLRAIVNNVMKTEPQAPSSIAGGKETVTLLTQNEFDVVFNSAEETLRRAEVALEALLECAADAKAYGITLSTSKAERLLNSLKGLEFVR